jgi:hypothetical protein
VAVDLISSGLDEANFDCALDALSLADEVRGYGPVKLASIEHYRPALQAILTRFRVNPTAGNPATQS